MNGLGDVQLAQGDLVGARKTQERALAMRQKLGEKPSTAESQMALARVSLEDGRAAEAESAAREAAKEFHGENVPDLEAAAYALLARALSQQGKLQESETAAKLAVSYSAKSQEPMIRISVAITAARVRNASESELVSRKQRASQVIHNLQALAAQAKKSGFLGLEFEARLAEAEVTLDSGKTKDGVAQLASLAEEAHARGFRLIAKKALAVRN